jgi:hypothetical protein
VATKRALTPLISIGIAYLGFLVGFLVLLLAIGPEYEHRDNLVRGVVFLGWAPLAFTAVAVSLSSLVLVGKDLRLWLRIATAVLNLPVLAAASLLFVVGIWSLQDYSASFAAYDTAVQVCGHPPVIGTEGWGAGYMLPNMFDYARQRYTTHDRFIFGGTVYYCTAADAEAHGLRPYP